MSAYYNEIEPFAAQWLRNLIAEKLIAPGDIDDRSIRNVSAGDIAGYTQCHFFAGIGIWSHALRSAGWRDDRPVWTGSCPCQPFSIAGRGEGFDDERHLWPEWERLIRECRPGVVFGEQVEGPAGRAWLDLLSADMEGNGYAIGAALLCSAGVGAPNIRHRLYWLANANQQEQSGWCDDRPGESAGAGSGRSFERSTGLCAAGDGLADAESGGCGEHGIFGEAAASGQDTRQSALGHETSGGGMARAAGAGLSDAEPQDIGRAGRRIEGRTIEQPSGPFDPWRELEWIACRDGKARPTQPGLFPLAPRHPGDVGKLRAYGNEINAQVAREFIAAAMECLP